MGLKGGKAGILVIGYSTVTEVMFAKKLLFLLLLLVIRLPQSRQQCQRGIYDHNVALVSYNNLSTVLKGYRGIDNTGAPVAYSGIEPNTSNCIVRTGLLCMVGSVLNDGDIGPTQSVNVSDPDQVRRFFVWHRDNGTVTLHFPMNSLLSPFSVSYIDIYTLSIPSAGIGSPGNTTLNARTYTGHGINNNDVSNVTTQSCSFSSNTNTLSRNTYTVSLTNVYRLFISLHISSADIDWLFISEIQLCEGTPPSSISCGSPTTTSAPTSFTAPTIMFSYPPPSGATVTPDLSQPDSVSLTCSVASPTTDDYQYQWQWWKNGTQLNNDNEFTITHTTNTQSSSLQISGLQYSDEGEYMCKVQYAMCPDGVDCREATPVTGKITLNLPGILSIYG